MKRKTAVAALTMLCGPLAGHATECSYEFTVTPPLSKNWTVETGEFDHRDEPPKPGERLHPFDRIVVPKGTSVTVELADDPGAFTMTVRRQRYRRRGCAHTAALRSPRGKSRSVGEFLGSPEPA